MTTSEQQPHNDTKCDNCGEELLGAFCWVCGQKDTHYNRSVFKVIGDFFKEMFDVDSRVFTTLSTLFFRPGKLSIQFRDNKRASYVTPIRLYLFSSLVFFFLVAITSRSQNVQLATDRLVDTTETTQMESSQMREETPSRTQEEIDEYLTSIRSLVRVQEDAFESAKNVLKGRIVTLENDPWSERIFERTDYLQDLVSRGVSDWGLIEEIQSAEEAHRRLRVLYEFFQEDSVTLEMGKEIVKSRERGQLLTATKLVLSDRYREHADSEFANISALEIYFLRLEIAAAYNGKDFVEEMAESLPLMMFVLLPIFVSVLSLLNLGKGIRVVFQLIFAMHIHALAFITLTVSILLSLLLTNIPIAGLITTLVLTLFIVVHVYLSFKNFYGSGHIISLIKFFVLTIVYGVVLSVSVLAMVVFFTLMSNA
ncbi:MAG: DUF3667 domain-containing protein [Gammaproteobacteria bacterium]|nr:DUF3667 domain-containing protein [Gammaproteobacteria bacterium]MYC26175.1 DUF3667 domain-containing protein [Gammaproteobacteria bacterium]